MFSGSKPTHINTPSKPFCANYKEMIPHINKEKRLRCYRNLHRDCWSVKQGIVRFHTNAILLRDVKFLVNEKVRQRVVANKRKEVHAFVEGFLDTEIPVIDGKFTIEIGEPIYYNPYETSKFMMGDEPIESCEKCLLIRLDGKFLVYKVASNVLV